MKKPCERSTRKRLFLCLFGALLIALMLELFAGQYRFWVTRDCEPTPLSLRAFQGADGTPVSAGDHGLALRKDAEGRCTVEIAGLRLRTVAFGLTLAGDPVPVTVSVSVKDEASLLGYANANNAVCVPGERGLNDFYGALYSCDELSALKLDFQFAGEPELFLTSVTLNPRVPMAVQPLRMALWFVAVFLLACMLWMPWREVCYQPGQASHRAVIVLPMLALLLVNLALGVFSLPEKDGAFMRGMWDGLSLEEAATDRQNAYGQLFSAFLNGDLHLAVKPSETLLRLKNPYDNTQRIYGYASTMLDYAMYDGWYFVYFGPGPVLLTYFPYYLLTGRVPTDAMSGMIMTLIAIPLIYLAVIGFVCRYTKRPNLFLLSLGCFAAACAAGFPMLGTCASRYANPISYSILMMAGTLGFGYRACARQKPAKRVCLFLLCGACFGAQGFGRANTLLISTALLAPAFVRVLMEKTASWRSRLRDAACFLVPALVGVGGVMLYNYARFGSVAEFGQLYQLTQEDIRYNVFRPEQIPQALVSFFLTPPAFTATFPYADVQRVFTNVTGNFFWAGETVGMLAYPLLWMLALLGAASRCYRTDPPALRAERGFSVFLPVALTAALTVVSYYYAGILQRYTHDYLFPLALISAWAGVSLCSDAGDRASPASRAMGTAFALACALTVLLSFAFGFYNMRAYAPADFYRLQRMFFPY